MWDKVIEGIQTFAPTVASALGGPAAGAAVSILSEVLLSKPKGTPKEISDVISKGLTFDQMKALKDGEQNFILKMEENGIKLEELAVADRDSARKRHSEANDVTTPTLAYIVVGGFFSVIGFVLYTNGEVLVNPTVAGIVGGLIGYASAKADQVISFYFGSSSSSKRKDETLHGIVSNPGYSSNSGVAKPPRMIDLVY